MTIAKFFLRAGSKWHLYSYGILQPWVVFEPITLKNSRINKLLNYAEVWQLVFAANISNCRCHWVSLHCLFSWRPLLKRPFNSNRVIASMWLNQTKAGIKRSRCFNYSFKILSLTYSLKNCGSKCPQGQSRGLKCLSTFNRLQNIHLWAERYRWGDASTQVQRVAGVLGYHTNLNLAAFVHIH